MTYPPSGPGYPPAQQPTTQFAAPTQQFGKAPEVAPGAAGPSKLPMFLAAAVAVLGLLVYVSSFGPLFAVNVDFFAPTLLDFGIVAALLAGLIAAVALVPKQKARTAPVAVLSVLGFLLVIAIVLTAPDGVAIDWGLYLIIAFTVLQAIIAAAALLVDAGVITPPAPRPKFDQQYGQYGGHYYGQPHHGGPPPHAPQQQRPGYPYGYPGATTGGFGVQPGGPANTPQNGPPTPPTGFPAYGQPPASSAPTTQVPAQPSSSPPSGQSSS